MGNRAVITSKTNKFNKGKNRIGLYLHWNGGRDSVDAFLAYAKAKGVRGAESDNGYCFARLAQIVGNYFGGTTSVGVVVLTPDDIEGRCGGWCLDNGVYFIDDEFRVVEGRRREGEYDLREFLNEINEHQSGDEQLIAVELDRATKEYQALYEEK